MDENYARRLRDWLRAEPDATVRRAPEERRWLRDIPEPARDEQPALQENRADEGSVRGQLPETPEAGEDWICPVIALPVPRVSDENGCRMSDAEARSRRNHPSNQDRRPMSEAEARSRWNHPTNWHRRRAEELRRRNEPGSH